MKTKITELGVLLMYPYPDNKALFQMMRQYVIEAADGRIDITEEWDEDEIITGDYEMSEDALSKIFDRDVGIADEEW